MTIERRSRLYEDLLAEVAAGKWEAIGLMLGLAKLWPGPVYVSVHGRLARTDFGNLYPVNVRCFPQFGWPFIEAIMIADATRNTSALTVVDAGAGWGDGLYLTLAVMGGPASIHRGVRLRYVAIDGEDGMLRNLEENVLRIAASDSTGRLDVSAVKALLSHEPGPIRSLLRTHGSTASAQGNGTAEATTLDELLRREESVHVLKTDLDGFDGKAISGARTILEDKRPVVIFEWHPILCRQTETDPTWAFSTLRSAGYDRFALFDRHGQLDVTMTGSDHAAVRERMAWFDPPAKAADDMHWDVIALHRDSPTAIEMVASLTLARIAMRAVRQ